jgi:hypothetical protein
MQPMSYTRGWRPSLLGLCVIAMTATGCIGAVDRADFENIVQARGGGLVSGLPTGAVAALEQRLGTADLRATVILLTAPDSGRFQLVVVGQPAHVTRFLNAAGQLAGRNAVAHFRIQTPAQPDQLDDYTYRLEDLSKAEPVQVTADDLSASFAISEVTALSHLEQVVDTAIGESGLEDGTVPAILVHSDGTDVVITVNVTAPRGAAVARFDRTGAFREVRRV